MSSTSTASKYAEQVTDWLVELGYTHCFFVAGGNIMHILNSVRTRMKCVPFVHEVGAGIAAEYFNESREVDQGKAFALVTAGPGLTNILTAMAGAFLESRDLLVVGGQVKSSDLANGAVRQRGIQEIDGIALAKPLTVSTLQIRVPLDKSEVVGVIRKGLSARKGPVFIEFCLDAQGAAKIENSNLCVEKELHPTSTPTETEREQVSEVVALLSTAQRPLFLIGGGVSRKSAAQNLPALTALGVPIATTWNAADRIDSDHPLYFGRPNTWGMRWSNVLLQQADLVIAVGTRLGMQQSGFNWQEFAPMARLVQVDIDDNELNKGHPVIDIAIHDDAENFLALLIALMEQQPENRKRSSQWTSWVDFGKLVSQVLPTDDPSNATADGFVNPFEFAIFLSSVLNDGDNVIPCSSGGAFTVMMQAFAQRSGQRIITDKGLASMGYGLAGALGASLAHPEKRTILVEGDGGFAQNLQELGTLMTQQLNVKVFLFDNGGYASIQMTQRNYFEGAYMGCDRSTGLGMPDWLQLFSAYGIPATKLDSSKPTDAETLKLLTTQGPAAFIVPIDPEQTYYPKINSRVTETGTMESSPLHLMFPPLDEEVAKVVLPYLRESAN
jgi:acetolactate synthase-1/2/3 large subunit